MTMTCLVTGAGRGIGLELARALLARGDRVIGTVRQAGADEVRSLGARVETLDVSDASSIAALAATLRDTPIDILIHNAGAGGGGAPLGRLDYDEITRFLQVNAIGPLRLTEALLPSLEGGRRKLVVGITSRMGSIEDNGSGGYYGYRASKAALNMFLRTVAIDLRPRGFQCVVLHPGWVRTAMGGASAPLSAAESVAGVLTVLDRLGPDDSGRFFDFAGNVIPW